MESAVFLTGALWMLLGEPLKEPMSEKRLVKCPICGREADFFADPLGPFCSVRCKMVDLGKWLGEEYKISEPLRPDHFEDYEKLEGGSELDHPEES